MSKNLKTLLKDLHIKQIANEILVLCYDHISQNYIACKFGSKGTHNKRDL
jgi:hypothetical protein